MLKSLSPSTIILIRNQQVEDGMKLWHDNTFIHTSSWCIILKQLSKVVRNTEELDGSVLRDTTSGLRSSNFSNFLSRVSPVLTQFSTGSCLDDLVIGCGHVHQLGLVSMT